MTACFAPGCDSRYYRSSDSNKAPNERVRSLFHPPKELFEEWKNAIPRTDKPFTMKHKLCELHFDEECIERTFQTKLPDGSIFSIDREKPRLKPGSIPTIFSDIPLSKPVVTNKRAYSSPPTSNPKTKNPKVTADEEDLNTDYTYENLLTHLKDVETPNSRWTIAPIEGYIICVKWSPKFHCERRVVVCKDLSVKIFLKNIKISLDAEVTDQESLSSLLHTVNNLVICGNIESKDSTNCLGYIDDDERQKICSVCRILKD